MPKFKTKCTQLFSIMFLIVVTGLNLALGQQQNSQAKPADEFQKTFDNATLLLRSGQIDEAINEFRRAAKLREDKCAECFQRIGQICLQQRRLTEAVTAFRQAADLKPANEAEMYNILGVALYLQNEKESYEQAVIALQKAIELSKGKVVKAYYNLGFALIKSGKEQEGVAVLKKFLELEPNATEAGQARAVVANLKMVDAKIAPAFVVKSSTGDELSLEKLRGRIVLLDFWASWCVPCRIDMPEVRKIWKKYSSDRFTLVGINLDSNRPAFDEYVKSEAVTWPQYYDGQGWGNVVARQYGVYAIPQTVLIDHEGAIRAIGLRGEELDAKIGELLAQLQSGQKSSSSK